jgi:hypothetical protein
MILLLRRLAVWLASALSGSHQLPLYVLGAAGAAFLFAFVLRAEAGVVFGAIRNMLGHSLCRNEHLLPLLGEIAPQ